jgi:hypothetical protein
VGISLGQNLRITSNQKVWEAGLSREKIEFSLTHLALWSEMILSSGPELK